jgi:AraC-like DNA-binding protein
MDALSEALNALRMGLPVPQLQAVAHVLAPGTERLVSYHLVTEGQALVRFAASDIPVAAGDVLSIPHGDAHTVSHGSPSTFIDSRASLGKFLAGDLTTMRLGGGGDATRFICGYFVCERHANRLFLAGLPLTIRINLRGDATGHWPESSVRHLVSEAGSGRPGQSVLLSRWRRRCLSRRCAATWSSCRRSRSAGSPARDPVVGGALALLHRKPWHHWTLKELAVEVGASRSVLVDRFRRFLGEPSLTYRARWRMQLGRDCSRRHKRPCCSWLWMSARSPRPHSNARSACRPRAIANSSRARMPGRLEASSRAEQRVERAGILDGSAAV